MRQRTRLRTAGPLIALSHAHALSPPFQLSTESSRAPEAEGRPKRREPDEQRGTKRALGIGRGGMGAAGPETRKESAEREGQWGEERGDL